MMSSSSGSGGSRPLVKSSILAPPKFGSSLGMTTTPTDAANTAQTKIAFHGLKQSKLNSLVPQNPFAKPEEKSPEKKSEVEVKSEKDEGNKQKSVGFIPLENVPENPGNESKELKAVTSVDKTEEKVQDDPDAVFVFGQNLRDRAANFVETPDSSEKDKDDKPEDPEASKGESAEGDGNKKTLSESAAEYCKSRSNKRKYDEVKVVTGEESERNVLQMYAKLHVFDKSSSNWVERGRGYLRLNDEMESDEISASRLVMRTTGALRVILNTPVFAGTTVENPSEKTVRLTGSDDGGLARIFLIGGNAKDIQDLFNLLTKRKNLFQKKEESKKDKKEETNSTAS